MLIIACAMLGASPQARSSAHESDARAETVSAAPEDSACAMSHTLAHTNPDTLLAEFLARDAAGEFLDSDPWFDGATQCPGQEFAPDGYQVIDRYTAAPLARTRDTVAVVVTSRRVGIVSGQFYSPAPATIVDTVRAVSTPYGWRIESPAMRAFIQRDVASRRGDLSITAPASRASSLAPDTAGSPRPDDLAARSPRLSHDFRPKAMLAWLAVGGVLVIVLLAFGWKFFGRRSRP